MKGKTVGAKLRTWGGSQNLNTGIKTYQSLRPVHPHKPIIAKWGFAKHGTYCKLFQTGPDRPKRPSVFHLTAFKETDQRYSEWEKGLLSLVQTVKQAEKIEQEQPVQTR